MLCKCIATINTLRQCIEPALHESLVTFVKGGSQMCCVSVATINTLRQCIEPTLHESLVDICDGIILVFCLETATYAVCSLVPRLSPKKGLVDFTV